jgi:hypothetical protein
MKSEFAGVSLGIAEFLGEAVPVKAGLEHTELPGAGLGLGEQ